MQSYDGGSRHLLDTCIPLHTFLHTQEEGCSREVVCRVDYRRDALQPFLYPLAVERWSEVSRHADSSYTLGYGPRAGVQPVYRGSQP